MPFKKHLETPKMEYLADLDKEMSHIINSKLSADEKVKLYNISLSKFLSSSEVSEPPLAEQEIHKVIMKPEPKIELDYKPEPKPTFDSSFAQKRKNTDKQLNMLSKQQGQIDEILKLIDSQGPILRNIAERYFAQELSDKPIEPARPKKNRALAALKGNEILESRLRNKTAVGTPEIVKKLKNKYIPQASAYLNDASNITFADAVENQEDQIGSSWITRSYFK